MWVKVRSRIPEVDARPSDAVTLALRVKAPIFVTPQLMEQASTLLITPDTISEGLEAIERKLRKRNRLYARRLPWSGGHFALCLGKI
jgi:bifunctional DNase/RNase